MKSAAYQPLVHRIAVLTACVALLPIVVGAVVTTMKAGMAFSDWPTSDGHNMITYPWLQSAGAKFIEHGHRLAGMLIGLVSVAFALIVWLREPRLRVRLAALCVLLAVIAQGLLGGARVRLDDRVVAMLHGSFAALVFALMSCVALATSRSWQEQSDRSEQVTARHLKPLAVFTAVLIFAQYLLGGTYRHLGAALYEHMAVAALVLIAVVATSVTALLSRSTWLRKSAYFLLGLVALQIVLGLSAYVVKLGYPPIGYVAVMNSTPQVLFCTAHTVTGMLLFSTAVRMAVRVVSLERLRRHAVNVVVDGPLAVDAGVKGAVS